MATCCNCGNNCDCSPCSACQTPFPETCEPLETEILGSNLVIQDSAGCFRALTNTVNPGIAVFDGENNRIADGSETNPVCLPELETVTTEESTSLLTQNAEGCFHAQLGTTANQVMLSTGTGWEATLLADMFGAGCGALVRDCDDPTVIGWQGGTVGQVLAMDASENARFVDASSIITQGSIDGTGLSIYKTTGNTILVNITHVVLRNSTTGRIQLNNVSVNCNSSLTGAGGLDTGVFASNFYWIYVIYNPTTVTTSTLCSLSPTTPTLPAGYTYFRRVGGYRGTGAALWADGATQCGPIYFSSGDAWTNALDGVDAVGTATTGQGVYSINATYLPYIEDVLVVITGVAATSGTTTGFVNILITDSTTVAGILVSQPIGGAYLSQASTASWNCKADVRVPINPFYANIYGQIQCTAIGGAGSALGFKIRGYKWNFI